MQIGTSASLGHEYCKLLLAMKRSAMEVRKSAVKVKVTQGTKGFTDVDQTCQGKVA